MRMLVVALRIPVRVQDMGNLPAHMPQVMVANHASYIDGLFLLAALPRQISFVVKRELERNFFVRIFLRAIDSEFVERFDQHGSVESADRLAILARQGRSFLFFPEGTFTRNPGLAPFHLGAFMVATHANIPVVPVSIRGTRSMMRDGQWLPRFGCIDIYIGAPIVPPSSGDPFSAAITMRDAAREHILAHCGEPELSAS
jgi:1-acyl-sn-glycerol-3-phosphate acyltransferase